jgi:hypothetical protein
MAMCRILNENGVPQNMVSQLQLSRTTLILLVVAFSALLILGIWLNQEFAFLGEPDNSILTGQPCMPPCWYGIIPGETPSDKAWKLLRPNSHVNQRTLQETTDRRGTTEITWLTSKAVGPNRLFVRDNVIQVIQLTPEFPITLGAVTGQVGNPDKVLAVLTPFENINDAYHILMYYPWHGLIIWVDTSPHTASDRGLIQPDFHVTSLLYLPRSSLDLMRSHASEFVPSAFWSDTYQALEQDWHGFGAYDVKMSP